MVNKIKIRLSILILSLIAIISIMTISISGEVKKISAASEDYKDKLIRFHVIANSDTEEDQSLKLKVRDKVVEALSEKLKGVTSLEEAEIILNDNIDYVNNIAKDVILNNNYDYEVNTMLSYENFPDKVYGDYVFPQGNYEAFRVIIGSGQGRNWWCVMFPSLCFVDESKSDVNSDNLKQEIENIKPKEINNLNNENDDIKFKSKMVDVVKNLFK